MSMMFPGMDPYLEAPNFWPGVLRCLVVYLADELQPLIRPRYVAAIEERVYLEGPGRDVIPDVWLKSTSGGSRRREESGATVVAALPANGPELLIVPDLEIHEPYIEILDRATGQKIITVIEVLSPSNKFPGAGRDCYLSKQREVRRSDAHLVEIDLLRDGPSVTAPPVDRLRQLGKYDYLVSVERAGIRGQFEIYRRSLRDPLPTINIPLSGDDPDVPLKLQGAIAKVYDAGAYGNRIDYKQPCFPPLSDENQAWADERIAASS